MSYISKFKKRARVLYDSLYCKRIPTKKEIGTVCTWHVDTALFRKDSIVYSGGVGNDISFELELAKKYGCKINLFDPSSTGINTMAKEENRHPGIMYFSIGLSGKDGDVGFLEPENMEEGSFRISENNNSHEKEVVFQCKSIKALMTELGHEKIDLLKIDIEGFEYEVLESIIDDKVDVKQICVEFHHFFKDIPKVKTQALIALLKKNGYKIIHKKMLDYTFVKNEG